MRALWQDIRYGSRMLARNPGFTAVVVLILAIGIGATTATLSIVDAVLFRSCPYKDSDSLACLDETNNPERNQRNGTSHAGFLDWRDQSRVFEQLVGADQWNGVVRTADRTEKSRGFFVSPDFFSVLGVQPILGRSFLPEEHERGGERVVVLSHGQWRRWFGGDPDVIGKTISLDKQLYTVVGVLPADFRWVFQRVACGVWMPMSRAPTDGTNRNNRGVEAIGRLERGVSIAQAQAEMDLIAERLARAYPDTNANRGIVVTPINEVYASMARGIGKPRTLLIVLGVASSVLLIACLHVANLLISRSVTREKEIAVRAALGAHRLRLFRQLLTEGILLAALAGLLGFMLAYWGIDILSALRGRSTPWHLGIRTGGSIPWFVDVGMDARTLLYTMGLSLVTCVLFGVLPAIGASRTDLNRSLSAGRTAGQRPRFQGLRALLVVLDVAVAFLLLIGAGLMINSYARILHIDPQVNTQNVLVTMIELGSAEDRYSKPEQRFAYLRQIMEGIGNIPGIQCVAIANGTPAWTGYSYDGFTVEGRTAPGEDQVEIRFTPVSLAYFRLFQIPLLRGRYFTEHDSGASTPVAVISESLARRFWPNEDPLGKHLTHGKSEPVTRQIVGVVRDVKHFGDFPDDEVYAPCVQTGGLSYPDVMVRVEAKATDLASAIRREILAVDPDVLVRDVVFMEQQISDLFSTERSTTLLLGALAGVALALASVGVYGVTAYSVSQRTQEIGIRMALGAQRYDVLRLVIKRGLILVAVGLVVGLAGAFALTRVISSLLYNVTPTDPLTFVCVSLLLAGIALLACYIPANRATRIDPMTALRYE
ncbi:MAG: ABC transporter permease [Phycisphaerales bacterium]|nr:MAG: ABC transporter permease [Phycisphaerales bacterium]